MSFASIGGRVAFVGRVHIYEIRCATKSCRACACLRRQHVHAVVLKGPIHAARVRPGVSYDPLACSRREAHMRNVKTSVAAVFLRYGHLIAVHSE